MFSRLCSVWKGGKSAAGILQAISKSYSHYVPMVVENTGSGERGYDIYSRLLKDRIVCLHSQINPAVSSAIIAQLLYLEAQCSQTPIQLYINSPGGTLNDGLAIYDTMQYVRAPVHTVCMGVAASMASVLLAGGQNGHRSILPNARIMIHQPLGGARGQASDIKIVAEEILKARTNINNIMATHTAKSVDEIEKYMERDYHMSAEEGVAFGIVDRVIYKKILPNQNSQKTGNEDEKQTDSNKKKSLLK